MYEAIVETFARDEKVVYAGEMPSPGDVGISAGDLCSAPLGAGTYSRFRSSALQVFYIARLVVPVPGPASNKSGASASAGAEMVLALGFHFGTATASSGDLHPTAEILS
jgi:hypothetical protein